nr:RNA-directed DNA polymerase, eukaryota [Tanacetum cinerariifolium]
FELRKCMGGCLTCWRIQNMKNNRRMGLWKAIIRLKMWEVVTTWQKCLPETIFDESTGPEQKMSDDPFDIYPLLNRKGNETNEKVNEEDQSLKFPPSFTPIVEKGVEGENLQEHNSEDGFVGQVDDSVNRGSKGDVSESVCSGRFKKSEVPRTGGSFLGLMEEVIKVGQTMGYNMEGCVTNLSEIIKSQGESMVHR